MAPTIWRFVSVMARAQVALGRNPYYQEINRCASDVELLLIDYFDSWFEREPAAAGCSEVLQSMDIDKESLDKGQQSRGVRAVSQGKGVDRNMVGTQKVEREALLDGQT